MGSMKEGYKLSELGEIPEDWEVNKLGSKCIKIGSGITPTGGVKVYKSEGRPFLRSQNVGWGVLILDDIVFIDNETHQTFKTTEIKKDDVFLNITGASIGRCAIADESVENGNVNQHVCIIRTNKSKLSPSFLKYFLLSTKGKKQIDGFQAGGNRQGLNFGQIKSFDVILPPIEEQKGIGSALERADDYIISLEKLINKKRKIKLGAMQVLLSGKKRLLGYNQKWQQKRLGEIGESLIGLTYSPLNVKSDGILVLRSSNIQGNCLSYEDNVYVDIEVSKRIITREGDILICVRNGSRDLIGKVALIDKKAAGETFGAFMSVFRTKYSQFVFHLFQTEIIKRQIREHIGATINQITTKNLNAFVIPFPCVEEQEAICKVLNEMDKEIVLLEKKLQKIIKINQGMMSDLLTGKKRLV